MSDDLPAPIPADLHFEDASHVVQSTVPGQTRLRNFKATTCVVASASRLVVLAWSPDSTGPVLAFELDGDDLLEVGRLAAARERAATSAITTYLTRGWGCKGIYA